MSWSWLRVIRVDSLGDSKRIKAWKWCFFFLHLSQTNCEKTLERAKSMELWRSNLVKCRSLGLKQDGCDRSSQESEWARVEHSDDLFWLHTSNIYFTSSSETRISCFFQLVAGKKFPFSASESDIVHTAAARTKTRAQLLHEKSQVRSEKYPQKAYDTQKTRCHDFVQLHVYAN